MRFATLLALLFVTAHVHALSVDSPAIGTWTGTLKGVMRNPDFTPSTQKETGDVTIVIWRIANGNPQQDGNYILSLHLWDGLKIGGSVDNGSLWSAGMHMPIPVGKTVSALSQSQVNLSTMTLIGQLKGNNKLELDGQFITQWTSHQFTIKARRYVGPVDQNGLPLVEVPTAISALEKRYPWLLEPQDGLLVELSKEHERNG